MSNQMRRSGCFKIALITRKIFNARVSAMTLMSFKRVRVRSVVLTMSTLKNVSFLLVDMSPNTRSCNFVELARRTFVVPAAILLHTNGNSNTEVTHWPFNSRVSAMTLMSFKRVRVRSVVLTMSTLKNVSFLLVDMSPNTRSFNFVELARRTFVVPAAILLHTNGNSNTEVTHWPFNGGH